MSAAVLRFAAESAVLPRVWATACGGSGALATAAERIGPKRLVLVRPGAGEATPVAVETAPVPEVAFYRKYTEGLLRRYIRHSIEAGRVPSLLGRELFRGPVKQYKMTSFEDVVIFVHDVEKCLGQLEEEQRYLIRRIALQSYTQGETAAMLGLPLRTVTRQYASALDALTVILVEKRLLEVEGSDLKTCLETCLKTCQGGGSKESL